MPGQQEVCDTSIFSPSMTTTHTTLNVEAIPLHLLQLCYFESCLHLWTPSGIVLKYVDISRIYGFVVLCQYNIHSFCTTFFPTDPSLTSLYAQKEPSDLPLNFMRRKEMISPGGLTRSPAACPSRGLP